MAQTRNVDYRALAAADARKYGLGDWFPRQINQESGFNPNARSGADARGIAQIVPRWHPDVDANTPGNQLPGVNPTVDLDYAARMMSALVRKYHGNVAQALSVYNSGKPDTYKDPAFAKGQTYNYVRSILHNQNGAPSPSSDGTVAGALAAAAPAPPAAPSTSRRDLLFALANTPATAPQTPFLNLLRQSRSQPSFSPMTTPGPMGSPPSAPATAPATGGGGGSLAELLHEGVGGPTHSTGEHIHVASTNPQTVLALIAEAQRRGLAVRENPYTDPVDPVHAKNSFHTRTFPGLYNGRHLGEAVDVSGNGMNDYEAWVRARYRR